MECWMNVCKAENSSYEICNFSSSIPSSMQKKCWMKCWTGLLRPLRSGVFYLQLFHSIKFFHFFIKLKKNISLVIVGFLFLFKLKLIPNYHSRCISMRFLEWVNDYPIRLVSLSEYERSNPSPLRNSYRKKYVPMETEGLSNMKIGTER